MLSISTSKVKEATVCDGGAITSLRLQLPLFLAHLAFYLVSLRVAVPLSDDGAFNAVGGWNLINHGGTGNATFGSWADIDEYLAVYTEGGALWVGIF